MQAPPCSLTALEREDRETAPRCESSTLLGTTRRSPEGLGDLSKSLPASVRGWGWSWTLPSHVGSLCFLPGCGTLPWVVNSASVAAPAPAQSLQVRL